MGTAERRERDLESREAALLAAAAALLEREDWATVTVEAIAAEAEYAKGTVYKHFASKDEIYARLALARTAELCAALEAIDAARPFEQVLARLRAASGGGTWSRRRGSGSWRAATASAPGFPPPPAPRWRRPTRGSPRCSPG